MYEGSQDKHKHHGVLQIMAVKPFGGHVSKQMLLVCIPQGIQTDASRGLHAAACRVDLLSSQAHTSSNYNKRPS
jgi:hypothetical protein